MELPSATSSSKNSSALPLTDDNGYELDDFVVSNNEAPLGTSPPALPDDPSAAAAAEPVSPIAWSASPPPHSRSTLLAERNGSNFLAKPSSPSYVNTMVSPSKKRPSARRVVQSPPPRSSTPIDLEDSDDSAQLVTVSPSKHTRQPPIGQELPSSPSKQACQEISPAHMSMPPESPSFVVVNGVKYYAEVPSPRFSNVSTQRDIYHSSSVSLSPSAVSPVSSSRPLHHEPFLCSQSSSFELPEVGDILKESKQSASSFTSPSKNNPPPNTPLSTPFPVSLRRPQPSLKNSKPSQSGHQSRLDAIKLAMNSPSDKKLLPSASDRLVSASAAASSMSPPHMVRVKPLSDDAPCDDFDFLTFAEAYDSLSDQEKRSFFACVNFVNWGVFINPSRANYTLSSCPVSTRNSEGKTKFVLSEDNSFNCVFLTSGHVVESYMVSPKTFPQCDKPPRVVRGVRVHTLSQESQTLFSSFGYLCNLSTFGCQATAGILDFRMIQRFDVNPDDPNNFTPSIPICPM
ncbi:hypothetical protein BT96DRAFT_1006498 [Gymnopus androsaceus JB14]|uniref:Uncharacterized protein n=1 Tax=Gymnopus androsaceus JB14 TaxID=1447944 RepID=A0A6A4GKU7_9AGAR|nr:hypothetical protein BT96DRAFT_1006498 [Gymnopus androsaceus JB14]